MMGAAPRARLACAPLANVPMVVQERKVCPPCLLTVGSRNNVLAIKDHDGLRTFGFFYEHDPVALARWDAHLDSRDAVHELPDGSLPSERAA